MKQTVYPGFNLGYPALTDEWKLRIMRYIANERIAPPRASVLRIANNLRADLQLNSPVTHADDHGDTIQLQTPSGSVTVDHVILATGFSIDLHSPAECADIAPHLMLWGDRLPDEPSDEWMQAPYLGDGFEFRSRVPDALPGLHRIRCFTHTAQLSLGNLANDIPAVSEGAARLTAAVVQDLFVDDIDFHWQRLTDYDDPELLGDEWPAKPRTPG
jgi:cation diffusion facilitator CzcD-associated flavoprotein CzcO